MARLYLISPLNSIVGPCKLGFSDNPNRRVKQLQTGYPTTLSLKFFSETDYSKIHARKLEKFLHRDLNAYKLSGEWFNISDEMAIFYINFTIIDYEIEVLEEKIFI